MSDEIERMPTAAEAYEAAQRAIPWVRQARESTEAAARVAAHVRAGLPLPEGAAVAPIDVATAIIEGLPQRDEFGANEQYARIIAWAATQPAEIELFVLRAVAHKGRIDPLRMPGFGAAIVRLRFLIRQALP